ncbi:MAG: asparaginase [Methanospirillum sp.]|nr:asparaginase [Methanospirillum sp.]
MRPRHYLSIIVLLFLTAGSFSIVSAADLPDIHILATGGTIAGTAENASELGHYQAGNLSVATLISSVPEMSTYARVTGEQICNLNSDEITPMIWLRLANRVNELLKSPDVDGVVITHGTDTLEETAYFLNLAVKSDKPVVITGAMRPATAISADGPLNLLNAVILAGSHDAAGKGVLILLNGEINGARDTTKTNTEMVETFRSPDFGLFGYMDNEVPKFYRESLKLHTSGTDFDVSSLKSLPKVDIVLLYPGADQTAIDAFVANSTEGLVVASMGNGGYQAEVRSALLDVVNKGIPVVISSRTGTGVCTPEDPEFIPADTLTPQKARVLLMLALTRTNNQDEIAEMFREY